MANLYQHKRDDRNLAYRLIFTMLAFFLLYGPTAAMATAPETTRYRIEAVAGD